MALLDVARDGLQKRAAIIEAAVEVVRAELGLGVCSGLWEELSPPCGIASHKASCGVWEPLLERVTVKANASPLKRSFVAGTALA